MLCISLKGPTYALAQQDISAALPYADLIELRLDSFESLDIVALKSLRAHFSLPMIFTLRSREQGGDYCFSEENRIENLRQLAHLKPEYLDLESHLPPTFMQEISSQHPEIKIILSTHYFSETPKDLEEIYRKMREIPAFFYKIAVTFPNCIETLRFVCWAKKERGKLIAISMGPHGQISRILAPLIGCPIVYACLEESKSTAPGQLSVQTLINRYRILSTTSQTSLYGLIGDPTDQSISDVTHNHWLQSCGVDALYLKMQVKREDLASFLEYVKQLPFQGISVTMPLKESILAHLDINPLHAVNTLLIEDNKILGFNTDGSGAVHALESKQSIKNKRLIILGAGGTAKAIACEAIQKGAHVTLVNRNAQTALHFAEKVHCTGKGFHEMETIVKEGYDILIKCTPPTHVIPPEWIIPGTTVMDVQTKPKETAFLKQAAQKKCRIVHGYKLFIEQALGQFNLWFGHQINIAEKRKTLEDIVLECLKD